MSTSSPSVFRDAPRLLTVEQVAERLGISTSTVYRLTWRRRLPFYRLPGGLRFSEADVRAFLRSRRVEPVDLSTYGSTQDS